jgi:hypothetical protein
MWVIDQFEEVFTLCLDEQERKQFLDNLLYAASVPDGRSKVVLAMRADFYSRCAAYPTLSALIAPQQFLVSPMDSTACVKLLKSQLGGSDWSSRRDS